MTYLAPGVYMAKVSDDLIILDTQADDYACLFSRAAEVTLGEGGGVSAPPDLMAALQAAGFVCDVGPDLRRGPAPRAVHSLPTPRPSTTAALVAVVECWCDALVFRTRPLIALIGRPRLHGRPRPDPARAVADFTAALPWAPANGACLQRAFQLRRRLARRGVTTDWVFGVRTWPFSAHCWLQIGDSVVGDRLERVRAYTPIAVF